jgi:hypothetical protein
MPDHTVCFGPAAGSSVQRSQGKTGHLVGKPDVRGILGDLEVNEPPAVEAEHDHDTPRCAFLEL